MKKNLLTLLIILLSISGSFVLAEVNRPSAPTYGTPAAITNSSPSSAYKKKVTTNNYANKKPVTNLSQTKLNTSGSSGAKSQLDALAMSALKEAEKRNNNGAQSYIQKMLDKGVTGIASPEIYAKRTPQCPPIKMELNGRNLSGKLCARMGYEYKGKEYWVGYCK